MAEKRKDMTAGPREEFDRRAFFAKVGIGSLGIAAAGTMAFAYEFLTPNVLYEPSPIINVGKPENFTLDASLST